MIAGETRRSRSFRNPDEAGFPRQGDEPMVTPEMLAQRDAKFKRAVTAAEKAKLELPQLLALAREAEEAAQVAQQSLAQESDT
jgi:hypothetical protein